MSDTPFDFSALLGDTRGLASSTARAVVLREVLPLDPFASLATAYIPEPPVLALNTPLEHAALVVVRAYLGALKAAKIQLRHPHYPRHRRGLHCPVLLPA